MGYSNLLDAALDELAAVDLVKAEFPIDLPADFVARNGLVKWTLRTGLFC